MQPTANFFIGTKRHNEEQLSRGEIKMVLQGKKLQGKFVLVHMGRARRRPRQNSRWLLIKRKDEYAKRSWHPEDDTAGRSVLTGDTLEEIVVRKVAQPVTTKGRSKRSAA